MNNSCSNEKSTTGTSVNTKPRVKQSGKAIQFCSMAFLFQLFLNQVAIETFEEYSQILAFILLCILHLAKTPYFINAAKFDNRTIFQKIVCCLYCSVLKISLHTVLLF